MKRYILFDMDGTLLNMGESAFEKEYLKRMVLFFEQRFPGKGKDIVKAVGYSAEAMKQNDGKQSNELVFWQAFERVSGLRQMDMEPLFLQYYSTDYAHIGDAYVPDADMVELVHLLAQKGYGLIVATNPLVPQMANQQRVAWSGNGDIHWLEITSFEGYSSAKPHVQFYQQICDKLQIAPADCMMIGNSLIDDLPAMELGMDFYLMLNEDSEEACKNYAGQKGNRKELLEFVRTWPVL
jgi:FMN phosphatase YigB (HAD superfamily)